jgi:NAD(P)-dependent dehydrogenase (short-subunit alcohol dehydrogenase family)
MGADFAKAALAAGDSVVAAGRDTDRVSKALGQANDLLPVKLDVTSRADAEAAVGAAVDRFGRIDVLVNNAADFQAGFFEEISPEQFRAQIDVNLFGTLNVTRVVLPLMRQQHAGHVITISSTAGLTSAAEFTRNSCRNSPRATPSRPSRTTTHGERRCSQPGRRRTDSRQATRRSSRRRSSQSPASSRRHAASSRGPTRSAPPNRRSPTCKPTSSPTGSSRHRLRSARSPNYRRHDQTLRSLLLNWLSPA